MEQEYLRDKTFEKQNKMTCILNVIISIKGEVGLAILYQFCSTFAGIVI